MAMGIRKVGDDSGSVYETEWYKESVVKAERGNREHIAKFDRSFAGIMAKADAKSRDLADGDDDDVGKLADHRASVVADLLVEAGSFPHRAAALQHLLHKPSGQALLARMHKAAEQTEKESPMTSLQDMVKSHGVAGVVQIAKNIVEEQKSFRLTEEEFCKLIDTAARVAHPELGARAFEKVYERNPLLARAIAVIKAGLAEQLLSGGMPVQVVGGADAQDVDDPSAALAALHRIGRERWPDASEAIRFTRAFEANPTLAAKAHRRPTAPPGGAYPYPR
jgi:hypothetical protein